MDEMQLSVLRDAAIEHLPRAQKKRESYKRWCEAKPFVFSKIEYAYELVMAAQKAIACDLTMSAVELSAARLLEAVCLYQSCDLSEPDSPITDQGELDAAFLPGIYRTARAFFDLLGLPVPFELPEHHAPSGVPESSEPPATVATPARVGIQSADIIERFRLDEKWHEKLRKPGRYKFLLPALAQRGRAGGDPHRWNPAKLGAILSERKERNRRAVAEVIYRYFTEWSDEWEAMPE